jgi:starvation-inducible DNA-binding protein
LPAFVKLTHFNERPPTINDSISLINSLVIDHDGLVMHARASINELQDELKDLGTGDFITGLMETHEKMVWMLRAHLQ